MCKVYCILERKEHQAAYERQLERKRKKREAEYARDDCFVATAVYKDRNAPQVEALREFRDNVLMQDPVGKLFVDFYYGGAGKRAASFIREHLASAIPAIRKGLDVLVGRYSAQKK